MSIYWLSGQEHNPGFRKSAPEPKHGRDEMDPGTQEVFQERPSSSILSEGENNPARDFVAGDRLILHIRVTEPAEVDAKTGRANQPPEL